MTTRPCRSCGAPIGFIELPNGRAMPVDPELVKTFIHPGTTWRPGDRILTLVTERGQVVRGRESSVTDMNAEQVEGFVPHWASCTDPKTWRRESNAEG